MSGPPLAKTDTKMDAKTARDAKTERDAKTASERQHFPALFPRGRRGTGSAACFARKLRLILDLLIFWLFRSFVPVDILSVDVLSVNILSLSTFCWLTFCLLTLCLSTFCLSTFCLLMSSPGAIYVWVMSSNPASELGISLKKDLENSLSPFQNIYLMQIVCFWFASCHELS
jgi:hypothetical protein